MGDEKIVIELKTGKVLEINLSTLAEELKKVCIRYNVLTDRDICKAVQREIKWHLNVKKGDKRINERRTESK